VGSALKAPGANAWWNEVKFFYIHRNYIDTLIARDDLPPLTDFPTFDLDASQR
jgi:hypothetical protein